MDRSQTTIPSDRFPFVVGVTGHRDLRDGDLVRLESDVTEIFETLKHDYVGDNGITPFILLSALAEGADQLVARVAFDEGVRLIDAIHGRIKFLT